MDTDALRARLAAIVADLCDGCTSPDDVAQKLIAAGARGACLRPECPIADYAARKLADPELVVEVHGVGDVELAAVRIFARTASGVKRPHLTGVELPEVARRMARGFDEGKWPELRIVPGRKRGPRAKGTVA